MVSLAQRFGLPFHEVLRNSNRKSQSLGTTIVYFGSVELVISTHAPVQGSSTTSTIPAAIASTYYLGLFCHRNCDSVGIPETGYHLY